MLAGRLPMEEMIERGYPFYFNVRNSMFICERVDRLGADKAFVELTLPKLRQQAAASRLNRKKCVF